MRLFRYISVILFILIMSALYPDSGDSPMFWYDNMQSGQIWIINSDGISNNANKTSLFSDSTYFAGKSVFAKLSFSSATELTIASGVVTVTQSVHTIDGEGDLSDDLVTINGGLQGDILLIYPASASRDITIVNGTGNILTANGYDYTIQDNEFVLLYYNGTDWLASTGSSTNKITDADGDTYVDVESTSDVDEIVFAAPNAYKFANNNVWLKFMNNAGTDYENFVKKNTSDEYEFGGVVRFGTKLYESDSGLVSDGYLGLTSAGSDGDENGVGVSIDGTVPIMSYGQNDGSGNAKAIGQQLSGKTVTTTDDTATVIDEIVLKDNTSYQITVSVVGQQDDYTDRATYIISGLFYRAGGNATQQGSTVSIVSIESNGDCDCVFAVSGSSVQIKVTGIIAETWNWKSNITNISVE
jgi:hypothetical protein